MINACIIGASGYTGAELAKLVATHPGIDLKALYVSANSADSNKPLSSIFGSLHGVVDLPLQPLQQGELTALSQTMDLVFLATPHEVSHQWIAELSGGKAVVMDLSGAYRFEDVNIYSKYYGFEHNYSGLLQQAVYGLADWNSAQIKQASIVAVPGCYPTASLTALKPLQLGGLIDESIKPVVTAVSGVSGAGRKNSLTNSFCEVSLQAYGLLAHRHQPEINTYLGCDVVFTPHLGNFKRGILATCTLKLKSGVTSQQVEQQFNNAYGNTPIVRVKQTSPKLDDVVNTPYCDIHWQFDQDSGYLIVISAIDNLLKGAASQAMQCANLRFGFPSHYSLIEEVSP